MKSITYKDYKLVPCDASPDRFDLVVIKIRKKKDTEELYESEDLIGYGYTLEGILQKIIFIETDKSIKEEKITLKEYLEQFERMKNEVISEIKNLLNIKIS